MNYLFAIAPEVQFDEPLGSVHHALVPLLAMQRLPDNPVSAHPTMLTRAYSMYSSEQCPKALAWMAALCFAAGRQTDAQAWLVELIGVAMFTRAREAAGTTRAPRDTVGT